MAALVSRIPKKSSIEPLPTFSNMELIKTGQNVLIMWGLSAPADKLQAVVDDAKKIVGDAGQVSVENIDRLAIGMCMTLQAVLLVYARRAEKIFA